MQLATLGGGCFWCTEAIFIRCKGVVSVTPGYAGGKDENPTYEKVSSERDGFAEVIQIKFEPKIISYESLLEIFWAAHDPTTLNRQGADVGTQYRSVIFYHNKQQKNIALKSKEKIQQSGTLTGQVVTEIVPLQKFYRAEEYHHNYYERNKNSNPYCSLIIEPKIRKLLDKFNAIVKEQYRDLS